MEPPQLSKSLEIAGEKILSDMGIGDTDWFVCLHVREPGFHQDAGRRDYRNADTKDYMEGIKVITDAGGWVIRLGDSSMAPLPTIDGVIDYARSEFRSTFIDVYLIRYCRFFVGCQSGPYDVARLFSKRTLLLNMYSWVTSYPYQLFDRGILKRIYSKSEQRFLSIRELFSMGWKIQGVMGSGLPDFEFYDNTSEEITAAITEFLDEAIPEKKTYLQGIADRTRREEVLGMIEMEEYSEGTNWMKSVERYRVASEIDSSLGTICDGFLQKYWT